MSFTPIDTIVNDPSKFYVAAAQERFGTNVFQVKVEYLLFPPHVEKLNKLMQIMRLQYNGVVFNVISVPLAASRDVREIAISVGMRIVDGVPFSGSLADPFPLSGPNVQTLENGTRPSSVQPPYNSERTQVEAVIRQAAKIWNAEVYEQAMPMPDGSSYIIYGLKNK